LVFWPVWIPFSAYRITKRRLSGDLALFGLLWGFLFYFPLFEEGRLSVKVVCHSIQYTFPDRNLPYLSDDVLRLFYLLNVTVPLVFCSNKAQWQFGIFMMVVSAFISYFLLAYAFVSLWCFFAAGISLFLCYIFYKGL
jgi:hypothetical protein